MFHKYENTMSAVVLLTNRDCSNFSIFPDTKITIGNKADAQNLRDKWPENGWLYSSIDM